MVMFIGNVGLAKDLRRRLLRGLNEDSTVPLVLDRARTVAIQSTSMHVMRRSKELDVTCIDTEDGTTVILHLSYTPKAVAKATIIRPTTEGE